MSGGIYIIDDEGGLTELAARAYESEDRLQALLAQHPILLAGDQIDPDNPRRWLLIAREVGVPLDLQSVGWVDHLFIDQDAIPTLIEVKRGQDTRLRREVVGQLLDYAANAVVYWPVEILQARFENSCRARGMDPAQVLADFLDIPGVEPDDFWAQVRANLDEGRVRLLFVADDIPRELQRVVEFLNRQMNPAEVLAIELRQYVGPGYQTLVPRVIGLPFAQRRPTTEGGSTRLWDETSFFETLQTNVGPTEADTAWAIYTWAQGMATAIAWGRGTRDGSFMPRFRYNNNLYRLFAVYTNGYIELPFYRYAQWPPFDSDEKRQELLDQLNAINGVFLPQDSRDRRPSLPLAALSDEDALSRFLVTYEWFIHAIVSTSLP